MTRLVVAILLSDPVSRGVFSLSCLILCRRSLVSISEFGVFSLVIVCQCGPTPSRRVFCYFSCALFSPAVLRSSLCISPSCDSCSFLLRMAIVFHFSCNHLLPHFRVSLLLIHVSSVFFMSAGYGLSLTCLIRISLTFGCGPFCITGMCCRHFMCQYPVCSVGTSGYATYSFQWSMGSRLPGHFPLSDHLVSYFIFRICAITVSWLRPTSFTL